MLLLKPYFVPMWARCTRPGKLQMIFSVLAIILFFKLNSFYDLCENGINIELTQEEESIGPNYMKVVWRFVYLLSNLGNNNNDDDSIVSKKVGIVLEKGNRPRQFHAQKGC